MIFGLTWTLFNKDPSSGYNATMMMKKKFKKKEFKIKKQNKRFLAKFHLEIRKLCVLSLYAHVWKIDSL
jgi:hypothetical protein